VYLIRCVIPRIWLEGPTAYVVQPGLQGNAAIFRCHGERGWIVKKADSHCIKSEITPFSDVGDSID
jgi:hypothetical protein